MNEERSKYSVNGKRMGRPISEDKKERLTITIDGYLYDQIKGLPNKSEFFNYAGSDWILTKSYKTYIKSLVDNE